MMSNFEHRVRVARIGQERRFFRAVRFGRDVALMILGAATGWLMLAVITA